MTLLKDGFAVEKRKVHLLSSQHDLKFVLFYFSCFSWLKPFFLIPSYLCHLWIDSFNSSERPNSMKRILPLLAAIALSGCAEIDAWREPVPPPVARDDTTPVFHVEGAQILTPSGQPFVARGINLQYGDSPALKYPSIAVIASVKANIVRLELRRNTTAGQLRTALDQFAAEKLPVMAMYWEQDITCHASGHILRRDVDRLWMKRWRPVLQDPKYAPYLMLNLANEWGTSKGNYEAYILSLIHI